MTENSVNYCDVSVWHHPALAFPVKSLIYLSIYLFIHLYIYLFIHFQNNGTTIWLDSLVAVALNGTPSVDRKKQKQHCSNLIGGMHENHAPRSGDNTDVCKGATNSSLRHCAYWHHSVWLLLLQRMLLMLLLAFLVVFPPNWMWTVNFKKICNANVQKFGKKDK